MSYKKVRSTPSHRHFFYSNLYKIEGEPDDDVSRQVGQHYRIEETRNIAIIIIQAKTALIRIIFN